MYNKHHKRVCIFVDGENLRHSIVELFPSFDGRLYLPKADWTDFFDWIAREVAGDEAERVRTYWYAVKNIDFSPYDIDDICEKHDEARLMKIIGRYDHLADGLQKATAKGMKDDFLKATADDPQSKQRMMEKRFSGWTSIQDGIESKHNSVEFRRAGFIRYDLARGQLGSEKSVDVKLATDLIKLNDIYDVAVIVSGDQDYVPAVETIKDYGKHTVNVAFQMQNGHLMPGGAKRLNQAMDRGIEVPYDQLKKYLKIA